MNAYVICSCKCTSHTLWDIVYPFVIFSYLICQTAEYMEDKCCRYTSCFNEKSGAIPESSTNGQFSAFGVILSVLNLNKVSKAQCKSTYTKHIRVKPSVPMVGLPYHADSCNTDVTGANPEVGKCLYLKLFSYRCPIYFG